MNEACEEYHILISGCLDGELDESARLKLEEHTQGCAPCRRELDAMKCLVVGTSAALAFEEPPEEIWESFLDSVYNRLERRTGWILLVLGLVSLAAYGVVLYWLLPWAPGPTKVFLALPAGGLLVLFVSVLRQRLRVAKTDRYSREIFK